MNSITKGAIIHMSKVLGEDLKPIYTDYKKVRKDRQTINNDKILSSISKSDIKEFSESIKLHGNICQLDRTLDYLSITTSELLQKCKDDILFAKLVAMACSKQASRQGKLDEKECIEKCNKVVSSLGINIKSSNKLYPHKDGRLLTRDEFNKLKIKKTSCLKIIDGEISGKLTGYIFAKITFTEGGHQDNVFEEARQFGDWAILNSMSNTDKIYCLLIDTDLDKQLTDLKERFKSNKNIWVVNHVELQEKIISSFL